MPLNTILSYVSNDLYLHLKSAGSTQMLFQIGHNDEPQNEYPSMHSHIYVVLFSHIEDMSF